LLTLFTTVGVYRWSHILTGHTAIAEWRADEVQGSEWYRRAVRAHQNCLENLPVYTAIVVVLVATRVTSPILDGLAIAILAARVCQTLIHLSVEQTNVVASLRFAFFLTKHVRDRLPAEGILEAANTLGCDLIVIASHGRGGLSKMLLGSVAAEVLTLSSISVLICR